MTTYSWPLISPVPVPVVTTSTQTYSAVNQARYSMLLDTAEGEWLTRLGQNYGVPRAMQTLSDETYRKVVRVLAWQPKTILFSVYALLDAVLGTQASIIANSARPWRVYEVNANEIVIEIPYDLIGTNNTNASYLHGISGYGFVTAGPSNTFTAAGNLSVGSATTLVGKNLRFNTAPGTWTDYTVAGFSYNSGTDTSTVTVSAATLPAGGGLFYIEIPGDGTDSARGDYTASSGVVAAFSTAAGPATATLSVVGDVTQSLAAGDTVLVSTGSSVVTTTVVSAAYVTATNVTTVVIGTTVAGGLTGQTLVRALEEAGTSTTPPVDDRIYLTGNGLYDVVEFYLDLLVRASGIVVRLELL